VANGPSYGGGMHVAPRASLADGLLDVIVIADIGKLEFLRTVPKVFTGRHIEHPAVAVHRAATVELDADRPLHVYADGEPAGTLPATFEVRRAALTVLAADPAPGFPPAG
jgi:diacylglycerol kinase (ATP)